MAQTLYDKLWQSHVVHTAEDGTSILYIDRHLIHEVTSPQAFEGLKLAHRQPWRKSELVQELDEHGQPLCEAGCYRCLLSYYNQPDHPLIDRQDQEAGGLLLDILCRLTESTAQRGTQGRAPQQQADELGRMSTSSLEKAWLAYVEAHGHLQPDRAQHTLVAAGVNADFYYDDYHLAVFIDGPHHDTDAQRLKDAEATRKLEDLGHIVVRFPQDTSQWPAIFAANADLFGQSQSPKT